MGAGRGVADAACAVGIGPRGAGAGVVGETGLRRGASDWGVSFFSIVGGRSVVL